MNSAFLYASRLSNKRDKGPLGRLQLFDTQCEVDRKISILREALCTSNFTIVHTGAGVSTASGISDFRGPSGVWTMEKSTGKRLAIESDCTLRETGIVVKYGNVVRDAVDIRLALPSKTHIIIAKLVSKGCIKHIITQNVDKLHLCSGIKFSQISELHGNLFVEACEICGRRYLRSFVIPSISFRPSGHFCGLCSFPPIGICTDVVLDWFDSYDPLYEERAVRFSKIADLHLCLGSSLAIQPACEYPSVEYHRKQNSRLFIVNYQSTPLDDEANQVIHDDVNKVVHQIVHYQHNNESITFTNPSKRPKRAAAEKSNLNMEMINKFGKSLKEYNNDNGDKEENVNNGVKNENITNEIKCEFISNTDGVKSITNIKNEVIGDGVKYENNYNYNFILNDSEIYTDKSIILTILRLPINSPNQLYYIDFLPILKNAEQPDPPHHNMEWKFSKIDSVSDSQIFLINSPAITSISGTDAILVDSVRGLWKLTINTNIVIKLDLWYNTSITIKLIHDPNSRGIEANSFRCILAYTDGDLPKNINCSKKVNLSTSLINVEDYILDYNGHIANNDDENLMQLLVALGNYENISNYDKNSLVEFTHMESFTLLYNAYSLICKLTKIEGSNLAEPTNHSMSAQPLFRLSLKNFGELNGNKSIQLINFGNLQFKPIIKVDLNSLGELLSDDAPLKSPPKKRRFTTSCFMKKIENKLSRFETLIINYIYDKINNIKEEFHDQLLGEIIARIPLWTINYIIDIVECR